MMHRLAWVWLLLAGAVGCSGPADHLVLITVDGLRPDALACGEGSTFAGLATGALVFDAGYATSSDSGPSLASLHTGQHPSRHGVVYGGDAGATVLREDSTPLAEHLRAHGFFTAAVVGRIGPARAGLDRGFERFDYLARGLGGQEDHASRVARTASERLAEGDPSRRLFLWIHFSNTVLPWAASDDSCEALGRCPEPVPIDARVDDFPPDVLREAYCAEVLDVERAVLGVLDELARSGARERALVVLAGAHGQALGEHGRVGAGGLHDEALHVPLIVQGRGAAAKAPVTTGVSLVDLAPTLLHLLEVAALPGAQGRSLVPASEIVAEPLFAEWRDPRLLVLGETPRPGDHLLAVRFDGAQLVEDLYVPEAGWIVDPGTGDREPAPIATRDPDRVRRLRGLLREHVQDDLLPELLAPRGTEIDEERLEALRSLGYLP